MKTFNLTERLTDIENKAKLAEQEAHDTAQFLAALPISQDIIEFLHYDQWAHERNMALFTLKLGEVESVDDAKAILNLFDLVPHYAKKGTYHGIDPHDLDPNNYYKSISELHDNFYVSQNITNTFLPVHVQDYYEKSNHNSFKKISFTRSKVQKIYRGYDTKIITHFQHKDYLVKLEIPINFDWYQLYTPNLWRVEEMRHETVFKWYSL